MSVTDFLVGRAPEYNAEDDQLAKPFPGEVDDLKIHAEICAMRYGKIMQGQFKSDLIVYDLKAFIMRAVVIGMIGAVALAKGPEILIEALKAL